MRLTDHAAKSNFKEKYLSHRRYFRLSEGLTRQHFYKNDFFQNDTLFSLLLFQNNVRKYVFVLQIECMLLSMFCTWFVTPLPLGNYCPLTPLHLGISNGLGGGGGWGGMDIFWNHTFKQNFK